MPCLKPDELPLEIKVDELIKNTYMLFFTHN